VGQETLDQRDLLTANLALTAQALLVARGHVGVQVLLTRAPVQNLFRGEKGERRSGQRLGRARGERAAPRASRRRASGASVSCERGYANGNGRVTIGASASWFPIRPRAGRAEKTLNPIRRWLIRARREGARARDASLGCGCFRSVPFRWR
jgi:hypothetical protein